MEMELMNSKIRFTTFLPVLLAVGLVALTSGAGPSMSVSALPQKAEVPTTTTEKPDPTRTLYKTVKIEGLDIFYREAGPQNAPTILLLHGFPTSSHMFRNLIPALSDKYHVVAPDYPGFGNSSMPTVEEFNYTFDHLAQIVETFTVKLGLKKYSIYLMDYGAPVGFRLAVKHPDRVQTLIVQNGNAYTEGLREFWDPIKAYWKDKTQENGDALRELLTLESTRWQYTNGTRNEDTISPDNWNVDQPLLDRPGNQEIQLALFYDYGSNPPPLSEVASLLSKTSATDTRGLGQERLHFSRRGSLSLQAGLEKP